MKLLKKDNAYIEADDTLAKELELNGYEVVEGYEVEEKAPAKTSKSKE
ncbi:hypothetical protein MUG87_01750 [Ectobacillus sp. JY-23]|nr:hypothetical protein [Ectobacillus sp. JY-23]UOY92894.1 hypothetical protein MUG87_01750 [Ectobacillus sp. JY-23]